jgi:hypothetical protein
MPTPNAGESKDDFISRCMAYPDLQDLEQDARFARCNGLWENKQMSDKNFQQSETFDVNDVEIFSTGKWNGDKYTEKDLDDMVEAYSLLQQEIKPFLKLGHDDKQVLIQKDGLPSAGWITNLKRMGNKLVADFKGIPRKIKELIEKKAYGRFSSEIYWDLTHGGKKYRRVLKAVALLGADTPAVQNLDDFINLYNENKLEYGILKNYHNLESDMDEQIVKDLQAEVREYKDQVKSFEADVKTYKEENDQLKKDKTELEGKVKTLTKDIETKEQEQKKSEIKLFINKAVEEKKILPSQVEKYSKLAESDFESVQDVIKNMPELDVNTEGESHSTEKPKKYEAMTTEEKDEFKVEKAYALMKDDKELNFRTALEMVEQQLGE